MKFQMTPEDFLKGQLVEPGWHPATINSWDDTKKAGASAKNPGSSLIEAQFKITAGPAKGQILYQNYSEVAPGFLIPLLEALGQKFEKTKTVSFEVESHQMRGKLVDIHVVRGSYNNKPKNEIDGYKAYTGPTAPATAGV